jgi:hypothetical protein
MAIENLISVAGDQAQASFYRTSGGAEIDLILGWPDGSEWAIEVKRGLAPKVERGLRSALEDIEPDRSFIVYPGADRYRIAPDVEAISLADLCIEAQR